MAADGADAADTRSAARAKCVYVAGEQTCLKAGQRCKPRLRRDYLTAGFECRRRRGKPVLVKAREAALRQGRFVHLQPNGYPSFRTALQAFDKVVADLPGVRQKRGLVGEAPDATPAVLWLEHYAKRLTRGQRTVLRRASSPPSNAIAAQTTPEQIAFHTFLQNGQAHLEAHGLRFNHPVEEVYLKEKELGPNDFKNRAWVNAAFLAGGTSCKVTVPPDALKAPEADLRDVATHELAHCAQAEFAATKLDLVKSSAWAIEGFANWAAATVARELYGSVSNLMISSSLGWLSNPAVDVTAREYDAMGFFALLEHEGVDPWALMGPVVSAGNHGNAYAAYALATSKMPDHLLNWGPTHASQPQMGTRWDLNAPGLPKKEWFMARIRNGTAYGGVAIPGRAGVSVGLSIEADVVTISPTAGIRGILRMTDAREVELGYSLYCTRPEGCQCDGEDIGAEPMPLGAATVGYASQPSAGGTVRVDGDSLDSYCDKLNHPFKAGHGITLYSSDSEHPEIIAEFASGPCSVDRDGFHASAVGGAYRLKATIANFKKFTTNQGIYDMVYRDEETTFTVTGPGGPWSNRFWPAQPDPPGSGVMGFGDGGRTFGIGMYPVLNQQFGNGVIVLGGMKCHYPPKRRR
jgi:hypothetical protein